MTVHPAMAKHRHDHAGLTYYFCCGGCLTKFVADPDRYLKGGPVGMGGAEPFDAAQGRQARPLLVPRSSFLIPHSSFLRVRVIALIASPTVTTTTVPITFCHR